MSARKSRKVAAKESKSKRRRSQQVKVDDLPADEAKQRGVKGGYAYGTLKYGVN